MSPKIMASDFDGTLRRYDHWHPYILRDDMEAIAAFRNHGNLFGMCSGRALDSIMKTSVGMPPAFYLSVFRVPPFLFAAAECRDRPISEEAALFEAELLRCAAFAAVQKAVFSEIVGFLGLGGRDFVQDACDGIHKLSPSFGV